jgi:hypothetical protein
MDKDRIRHPATISVSEPLRRQDFTRISPPRPAARASSTLALRVTWP